MPNLARGEASFTTHAGQKLTLVVDFNALAEAEYAVDMGANEILSGLSKGRIKAMRGITLGALARRHPDMTIDDVDELLQGEDAGPLAETLMQAVQAAFPQPSEAATEENPPEALGSTGTSSAQTGPLKA
jgi:hypothetical protein